MSSNYSIGTISDINTDESEDSSPSSSSFSPRSPPPPSIPLYIDIPSDLLKTYPNILYTPYTPTLPHDPRNTLSLIHNAARREICDIITKLLPSLKSSQLTKKDFNESLLTYWNTTVRYFFFIADTDDDITKLVASSAMESNYADSEMYHIIQKQRKSINDRYNFAMEHIFRAADNNIYQFNKNPDDPGTSDKLYIKLNNVIKFMLDSMKTSEKFLKHICDIFDFKITDLESKVINNLFEVAKKRNSISIFLYITCRWMKDDNLINNWLQQYIKHNNSSANDNNNNNIKKDYEDKRNFFITNVKTFKKNND